MDEARKENVMSVEVAIQRELAYRKKIASLRSHSDCSMEHLKPLQVPSSFPTRVQNPRPKPEPSLISSSNTYSVPPPLCQLQASSPSPGLMLTQYPSPRPSSTSIPSQGLVPNSSRGLPTSYPNPRPRPLLAPSQVPTLSSLARPCNIPPRPSLSGIKRKATSSDLQCLPPRQQQLSQDSCISVDSAGSFFCKVCQVPCSGPANLKQHLKGHKHKTKLQWLRQSKRSGKDPRSPCELCQIWCMDKDAVKLHLKGQKHQAKLQELKSAKKNGKEKEAEPLWCELCHIWCMNEDAFQQHLKGKNHAKNMAKGEEATMMKLECETI